MSEYKKPIPFEDEDTKPYWDGCRDHQLRIQRCADCQEYRFPPRPMCPACHSMNQEWVPVSGRGKVFSWVVIHPPVLPAFQEEAPFSVALIQLEEDPRLRLLGRVLDISNDELAPDIAVEVTFDDVTDELTLPAWRRAVATTQ